MLPASHEPAKGLLGVVSLGDRAKGRQSSLVVVHRLAIAVACWTFLGRFLQAPKVSATRKGGGR
jgi:hypothetical protein